MVLRRRQIDPAGFVDPARVPEFRDAYEAERARLLRRRAVWYHAVLIVLALGQFALLPFELAELAAAEDGPNGVLFVLEDLLGSAIILVLMSAMLAWVVAVRPKRPALLRAEQRVLSATGIFQVASGVIAAPLVLDPDFPHDITGPLGPFLVLASLLALHGTACLFLPWTPREAARPMMPVLATYAIAVPVFSPAAADLRLAAVLAAPLAAAPGLLVCWVRTSLFAHRFLFRVLQGAYGDLRQELVDARAVHESMLPAEIDEGPVRFRYHFRPFHLLGGDFVFARRRGDAGRGAGVGGDARPRGDERSDAGLDVVLVDVTGHGIRASLAVNRLAGELERVFAEEPDATPGRVLEALDRYVLAVLAPHGVYATAIALRLEAAGPRRPASWRLAWAGAGHPPAALLERGGGVSRLESAAPMLGVATEPPVAGGARRAERTRTIAEGDRVVVYTDGLTETRLPGGGLLGIDGAFARLAEAARAAGDGPLDLAGLDGHRRGGADDDMLIAEIAVGRAEPPSIASERAGDAKAERGAAE